MVLLAAVWSWSSGWAVPAGSAAGHPGATAVAVPGTLHDSRSSALIRDVRALSSRRRLFGELGGRSGRLEDAGIMPSLHYNHFLGVQAQGGHNRIELSAVHRTGFVLRKIDATCGACHALFRQPIPSR